MVWTEEATSAPQDCFDTTDWDVFAEGTDLEGHTTAVLSYINFCDENVAETKTNRAFPNQKLWLNSEVWTLLRAWNSAFKSAMPPEYKEGQNRLRKGIRVAKNRYNQHIEEHFNNNESRCMWQGIKTITGHKDNCIACIALGTTDISTSALPDTLNQFFTCFDWQNKETNVEPARPEMDHPTELHHHQGKSVLHRVDIRKAAGLDVVSRQILKACASGGIDHHL